MLSDVVVPTKGIVRVVLNEGLVPFVLTEVFVVDVLCIWERVVGVGLWVVGIGLGVGLWVMKVKGDAVGKVSKSGYGLG